LTVLLFAAGTGYTAEPRDFTFPRANRTYANLSAQAEPILWGPSQIRLATPSSELTVHGHRLRLTPLGDKTHRFQVDLEFSGDGTLVADVEALGFATHQEDQVELPQQSQTQTGRVRVVRGTQGYFVTSLEIPRRIRVAIRSRLAARLVAWCKSRPLLGTLGGGCENLNRFLSSAVLPLPPPGETYLVPYHELAPAERELLDRYLEESGR
jgi:hypothetical protein